MNYPHHSPDTFVWNSSLASSVGSEPDSDIQVIQGQYLGDRSSSKGYLKYLYLQHNGEEKLIKVPKSIGHTLVGKLSPGMMLQVWIRPKKDYFKALMVLPAGTGITENHPLDHLCETSLVPADYTTERPDLPEGTTVTPKPQVCTLKVCTKGKCSKKGGRQVMHALEQAIAQASLEQHVRIQSTGCLRNCKQGPTIQVSPGSETYSFVHPQDAAIILRQHAGS